jgi:hypothetical protein
MLVVQLRLVNEQILEMDRGIRALAPPTSAAG